MNRYLFIAALTLIVVLSSCGPTPEPTEPAPTQQRTQLALPTAEPEPEPTTTPTQVIKHPPTSTLEPVIKATITPLYITRTLVNITNGVMTEQTVYIPVTQTPTPKPIIFIDR